MRLELFLMSSKKQASIGNCTLVYMYTGIVFVSIDKQVQLSTPSMLSY